MTRVSETPKEKRKKALEILVRGIDASSIDHDDTSVMYSDDRGNQFNIFVLSRQLDLAAPFEPDPTSFDDDRRKLQAIDEHVASLIVKQNEQGVIPGFIFIEAEVDFDQLKGQRTSRLINHGHFLKMVTPSRKRNAHFNYRMLDPIELVVSQYYAHTESLHQRSKFLRKERYRPGSVYLDVNKEILREVYFSSNPGALSYMVDDCPICHKDNSANHEECKETPTYQRYREARDMARYARSMWKSKERKLQPTSKQLQIWTRGPIAFEPSRLVHPRMKDDTYSFAILANKKL